MKISEISGPIIIKFHQKHHWGGGLTALGFGLDWIRTLDLVSMATDNSNMVIMGKSCDDSSAFVCDWFFFNLTGNKDNNKIPDGSKIRQDLTKDL